LRDRSRAAGRRAHGLAAKLRLRGAAGREEAQRTVQRITGELSELAERAAADAERLLTNAPGRCARAQARPSSWPHRVGGTPPPVGAGAGCVGRSTT
jgi:IS5 family transposase